MFSSHFPKFFAYINQLIQSIQLTHEAELNWPPFSDKKTGIEGFNNLLKPYSTVMP